MQVYVWFKLYPLGGSVLGVFDDEKLAKRCIRDNSDCDSSTCDHKQDIDIQDSVKEGEQVNVSSSVYCSCYHTRVDMTTAMDYVWIVEYNESAGGGSWHSDYQIYIASDLEMAMKIAYDLYENSYESTSDSEEDQLKTFEEFCQQMIDDDFTLCFPNNPYEASITMHKEKFCKEE